MAATAARVSCHRLAMAVDRAGGEIRYTRSEYLAIQARRGRYRIQAEADRSAPGEPVIVVRPVAAPGRSSDPIS
jgi:hypothetical protein